MSNTSREAASKAAERHAPPRLELVVQYGEGLQRLPQHAQLKAWAAAAMLGDAAVTLRLVDEAEGRWLNRRYRGRDYPTNVLTFAYPDTSPLQGDIAVCVPVVSREASEQGKTFEAHLAHLVVHGMLHLQGFDHESAPEAELMEGIETEILGKLGYPDPYGQEG